MAMSASAKGESKLFDDVKPRGDARVVRFSIRLSREEWRELLRQARDDGRTAANYVRAILRSKKK